MHVCTLLRDATMTSVFQPRVGYKSPPADNFNLSPALRCATVTKSRHHLVARNIRVVCSHVSRFSVGQPLIFSAYSQS